MRGRMGIAGALAALVIAGGALAANDRNAGGAAEAPAAAGENGFEALFADLRDLAPGAELAMHGGPGMHGESGPHGGGHGTGMGSRFHAALSDLDLTDGQRNKLATIHNRQRRKAIPIRADIETAMLDLHQLLREDDPDLRAVDTQVDEIAGLRANLHKLHLAGLIEARAVLTAAQRKKLHEHFPVLGFMGPMHGGPDGRNPRHGHGGMGH